MILQNDPVLTGEIPEIKKNGCYFMSILAMEHLYFGGNTITDYKKIVNVYRDLIRMEYMREDCYISNPLKIFNYFKIKGLKTVRRCNTLYNPKDHDLVIGEYVLLFSESCNNNYIPKYDLIKIRQVAPCNHFVLLDKNLKILYDGYGDSLSCKYGKLNSLRVYTFATKKYCKGVDDDE